MVLLALLHILLMFLIRFSVFLLWLAVMVTCHFAAAGFATTWSLLLAPKEDMIYVQRPCRTLWSIQIQMDKTIQYDSEQFVTANFVLLDFFARFPSEIKCSETLSDKRDARAPSSLPRTPSQSQRKRGPGQSKETAVWCCRIIAHESI